MHAPIEFELQFLRGVTINGSVLYNSIVPKCFGSVFEVIFRSVESSTVVWENLSNIVYFPEKFWTYIFQNFSPGNFMRISHTSPTSYFIHVIYIFLCPFTRHSVYKAPHKTFEIPVILNRCNSFLIAGSN